jgi:hypothetical protein
MMHGEAPASVEALAPAFLQNPVPKPPAGLDYGDVDSYTLSVTPPEENDGIWQVDVTPGIISE